MKKRVIAICVLILIAAIIFWCFYPLRSMLVMSVYSAQQSGQSVMRECGIKIEMPAGGGWYPFVMTYNAEEFARWSGIDAKMSIMYNFGAFDFWTRTSSIYDSESDRYSSFYGAYVLKQDEGSFGFSKDGSVDMEEVKAAVEYDYTQLVMAAFGCLDPILSINEYDMQENAECAGSAGWVRLDAQITANGAAHNYTGYITPYLQYGRPMKSVEEDFAPVKLYGRVYIKYFEEYGCTVMVYVIASSENTAAECDGGILSKTQIKALN